MEAKDTVMSDELLDACRQPGGLGLYDLREVARRQAEISFKAGMKEVVEWVLDNHILDE